MVGTLSITYRVIGEVTEDGTFSYGNVKIPVEEALEHWTKTLESVFPTKTGQEKMGEEASLPEQLYRTDAVYICDHKVGAPRVFIPVFPGTNCEYDSTKAFKRAGALVTTQVFRNLSAQDIRQSAQEYCRAIEKAQIIMFPGGFSAGDEPEGSAKFFAAVFRSPEVKEAIHRLLNERDGLMLGICNGFQALIKLGLVPYGTITEQKTDSPTLTMNTIGRHVSKMVYTKVVTNKSPCWQGPSLAACTAIPPPPRRRSVCGGCFLAPPAFCQRTGGHPVCGRSGQRHYGRILEPPTALTWPSRVSPAPTDASWAKWPIPSAGEIPWR